MSCSVTFATGETTGAQPAPAQTAQAAQPSTGVMKINGKYYYKSPHTNAIRRKAGFIDWNGDIYYVQKGGVIPTGKTFTVGKYRYRAYSNGRIAVGVYKWNKKLYYSNPKNGRCVFINSPRQQKGVKWKGNWYYLQTGSAVATNRPVVINDLPYYADSNGVCTPIEINETNNPVLKVARNQIGKRTKTDVKGFWTWFFGSRFIDTDATPWCGTFVGWCYKQAGQYNRIKPAGNIGFVPCYIRFACNRNKWINRTKAKEGDIIVFGRCRHVGIVERVYKGYIYTIEGNSGPDSEIGSRKPGAVTRRVYKLNDKDIRGVIRP